MVLSKIHDNSRVKMVKVQVSTEARTACYHASQQNEINKWEQNKTKRKTTPPQAFSGLIKGLISY